MKVSKEVLKTNVGSGSRPLFMRPQDAKAALQRRGITLRQFAQQNNFNYRTVSEVVRGLNKGNYGEGHRVAVALGLKEAA